MPHNDSVRFRSASYYKTLFENPNNCTEKNYLKAVEENGLMLKYVKQQTFNICLTAVKQFGHALQFVELQTPEICLAAVKRHGESLQYVDQQTPEICLAAIEQNPRAEKYIKLDRNLINQ